MMKISKSMVPLVAIVSLTAGLITAAPAQAAVKLPAGCTTYSEPQSRADVHDLECKRLAGSANFSQYPNLSHLIIGPEDSSVKSLVTAAALPALPKNLQYLSVNAPKMKKYSTLGQAKNLESLSLFSDSNGLNLSTLPTATPKLEQLLLVNTKAVNLQPISKLRSLQELIVSGTLTSHKAVEGSWKKITQPTGLNGKALLPENSDYVDDRGRKIGKEYTYNSKTKQVRYNVCQRGSSFISHSPSKPASKAQPRLKHVNISYQRSLNIDCLSEWAKDKKNTLRVTGATQIGKTVTARLSKPSLNYIDKYQWYRGGKAIKGATKSSYKLVKADLGKKITVKATDTKDRLSFTWAGMPKTAPYSVTKTATNKALYGFSTKKPAISGTAKVGKTLKAKTAKWGGSPSKYSYQWLRDGKAVKGATKSSYKVAKADRYKKISVKVSGSKKNYQTASSTSTGIKIR